MDTALPQKFPFILDRNLANCTGNWVCRSCDTVVLGYLTFSGVLPPFAPHGEVLQLGGKALGHGSLRPILALLRPGRGAKSVRFCGLARTRSRKTCPKYSVIRTE